MSFKQKQDMKKHYAVFGRNRWADSIYPCGEIVKSHSLGTRIKKEVECIKCRKTEIFKKQVVCVWTYDEHHDKWDTDCGEEFCFSDGGPKENKMKFCCYCGKRLTEDVIRRLRDKE